MQLSLQLKTMKLGEIWRLFFEKNRGFSPEIRIRDAFWRLSFSDFREAVEGAKYAEGENVRFGLTFSQMLLKKNSLFQISSILSQFLPVLSFLVLKN